MSAFGDYLAHNIKPRVVCEECRDALLMRTIFPVSGMMVFDYGLECAHLSLLSYTESGGVGQGYSFRFDPGELHRESLMCGA
jgi:hypothetical protein